ncbi:hypothetical protein BGZ70_000556 [Mortierella alpina]|uniref:Uncharacterized protein n=1 Tax=Mortierella alpina TaxID=64518 RepID=A0A9P6IXT2_MORAP|nr:hypothetical protein BGZ70_000556 [Mortierella alpina]
MNKNSNNREGQPDLDQRSSQQTHSAQATARTGQQDVDRAETPSGQSKIEAPMSGKKMCGHAYDCDCSTEKAIHAPEEHAPKINRTH